MKNATSTYNAAALELPGGRPGSTGALSSSMRMIKKLLYLLILLPGIARAQHWRIGLGGGASFISKPDLPVYHDSKMAPGAALTLSAVRLIRPRLELGLDISAVNLLRTGDVPFYSSTGSLFGTYGDARIHVGEAAVMITPSLSYSIHHFYFGPQLGFFFTTDGSDDYSGSHAKVYYNDFTGFCAGVHAGFSWHLRRQLLIYAEARSSYLHGTQKINGVSTYGLDILQGGLLLGLKYEF